MFPCVKKKKKKKKDGWGCCFTTHITLRARNYKLHLHLNVVYNSHPSSLQSRVVKPAISYFYFAAFYRQCQKIRCSAYKNAWYHLLGATLSAKTGLLNRVKSKEVYRTSRKKSSPKGIIKIKLGGYEDTHSRVLR